MSTARLTGGGTGWGSVKVEASAPIGSRIDRPPHPIEPAQNTAVQDTAKQNTAAPNFAVRHATAPDAIKGIAKKQPCFIFGLHFFLFNLPYDFLFAL
jgi:hypothetical protein